MSADWPVSYHQQQHHNHNNHSFQQQQHNHKSSGDESVSDLIYEIINCLLTHPSQDWMYDVVFFTSNLFLTLLSTQLYQISNGSLNSRDDLFMDFIYITAEIQLRSVMMKVDGDISHTRSGLLIKALILNINENLIVPKDSFTKVLMKSNDKLSNHKPKQALSPFIATSAPKDIFSSFGFFFQNPLKALVRLVRITSGLHIEDTKNHKGTLHVSSTSSPTATRNTTLVSNYRHSSQHPVAEKSLKILLILLNNKRFINCNICNPFREAFRFLNDERLDNDFNNDNDIDFMGKSSRLDNRRIHCDFKALSNFFIKTLPDASSAQLLYSFMQLHPTFMDNLTALDNFNAIITAILKGLYNSCNATSVDHLYILVVVALMITQDSGLRSKLSKTLVRAPWYTERMLGEVSIVDLTVLCVLRTTMYGLYHLKGDQYLLSNCYAILLNIAPYLIGIHTYSAERLVTIIRRVGARFVKDTAIVMESGEKDYLLRCMKETLTVLIRITGVALRPLRRASNVHLVYALIHENNILLDLFLNPIIISLTEINKTNVENNDKSGLTLSSSNIQIKNNGSAVSIHGGTSNNESDIGSYNTNCLLPIEIVSLIKHYLKTIESRLLNNYMTAKNAIELLRQEIEDEQEAILNIRANELSETIGGRLDDDDAMTSMTVFTYEEGDNPEDFFVPFVWTNMIMQSPEMCWFLNSITLFDTLQAGLSFESDDNTTSTENSNV